MRGVTRSFSPLYFGAIRTSLIQQLICTLLSVLMLDSGRQARICLAALIGFWAGAAMILLRRPDHPSRLDVAFLRIGFLPILIGATLWAHHA